MRDTMSVLSIVSLVIALLSMGSQFFQNWNYSRNIEAVQRNVLRAENLRTCRDIIDVFFQFRLKADEANASRVASSELKVLTYKFGALGTHLANFRDEEVRARYGKLSWGLLAIAEKAATATPEDYRKSFDAADAVFSTLNDDCAKTAQRQLL